MAQHEGSAQSSTLSCPRAGPLGGAQYVFRVYQNRFFQHSDACIEELAHSSHTWLKREGERGRVPDHQWRRRSWNLMVLISMSTPIHIVVLCEYSPCHENMLKSSSTQDSIIPFLCLKAKI
eukprot:2826434-Amphidinium_carterae.1